MNVPESLTQLVESTADAAFAVDARGVVRLWNAAASELLGWSGAEVLGKEWSRLLDARGALGTPVGRDVGEMALAGQRVAAFDCELRTRDGGRHWVSLSTLVFAPPRSRTRLVIFVAQDVHRRRTREQLVERMLATADRLRALGGDTGRPAPVTPLTRQEERILRLFAQGRAPAAVARALGISAHTLRNHLHHVNRKLRTHSRVEAVTHAIRRRLI